MEEDILNYLYQLSCFVGHPVYEFLYEFDTALYQFLETETSDITFIDRNQELK